MAPNLCHLCQQFDIRKLLLLSAKQDLTSRKTQLTGNLAIDVEWRSGIPDFFRHQNSLTALEKSSRDGCDFCTCIWETWSKSNEARTPVDAYLDKIGQGQIFIGTSGCNVTKRESPSIAISQRPANESPRTLCNFEVFATTSRLPRKECQYVGNAVSAHSTSKECEVIAREWYHECIKHHNGCGPVKSQKPIRHPTRLVNVGGGEGVSNPFLDIESDRVECSWAALSYCWGGNSTFTLRQESLERLTGGIPLEDFPATLRDAIIITRQLGLQYLWIDSICIKQDSKEDWEIEASRMRDVYAGASVTVVAAGSDSTNAGIFKARATKPNIAQPCELPWGSPSTDTVFLRPSSQLSPKDAYSSVLHTRGWTLQEGLLSSRTLSYGSDQMVWECTSHRLDESGHTILLDNQYDSKDLFHGQARRSETSRIKVAQRDLYLRSFLAQIDVRNQFAKWGKIRWWYEREFMSHGENIREDFLGVNPYYRWAEIVFEFSKRRLTNDTDVLPALSGIAQELASITRDTYYAGMWKSHFLLSLSWRRLALFQLSNEFSKHNWTKRYTVSNFDWRKPTAYRAPSWSWACINGGEVTMYPLIQETPIQSMAAVVKVHLEPQGKDPFGQIRSGYLLMKGPLFLLGDLLKGYWKTLADSWESFRATEVTGRSLQSGSAWPYLHDYVQNYLNNVHGSFEFEQQHSPHPNQRFAAFLMIHTEGLPSDEAENLPIGAGHTRFLILESTGSDVEEYRRIGIVEFDRPTVMGSVYGPTTPSKKPKKDEEWFADAWRKVEETRPTDLPEVGAWLEIAHNTPKPTTIRII